MNRSEREALMDKLQRDNAESLLDIAERRARRLSGEEEEQAPPRALPRTALVYKTHEPPPAELTLDANLQAYLDQHEQAMIDGAVAFTNERLAEEIGKLQKSIARLRKDLAREKQINTAANVDRIKGKS